MSRCRVRRFSLKLPHAAGAIAALPGTRAVGVKTIAKVGIRTVGRRDHQDLIASNATPPVREAFQLGRIQINRPVTPSMTMKSFPAPCIW